MFIMEDHLPIKLALFDACVKAQEKIIANAKEVIEEVAESATEYTDTEEESFDSYREQLQQRRDMYTTQMLTARNDLDYLRTVPYQGIKTEIEEGAIVRTNVQNFFIAISLGRVEAGGKSYFAISTSAPIYSVMDGLKAGATFHFRDRDYKILEVF
jgi:TPP-dependent trihydroxycyclohexane-1,2-dione (THcHDO) dehydratase